MSRRRDFDTSSVARLRLTPGQLRAIEGLERGRRKGAEQNKLSGAKNAALVMNLAMIDLDSGREFLAELLRHHWHDRPDEVENPDEVAA